MTEVICTDTGAGRGRGKCESQEKKEFLEQGGPFRSRAELCYAGTQRVSPCFQGVLCNFLNVLFSLSGLQTGSSQRLFWSAEHLLWFSHQTPLPEERKSLFLPNQQLSLDCNPLINSFIYILFPDLEFKHLRGFILKDSSFSQQPKLYLTFSHRDVAGEFLRLYSDK